MSFLLMLLLVQIVLASPVVEEVPVVEVIDEVVPDDPVEEPSAADQYSGGYGGYRKSKRVPDPAFNETNRIVGGQPAQPGSWPFVVTN